MTNKKQLIYKEDLIAEYDRVHIGEPGNARKLMEDAPTVDAVEVVHGHCNWCKPGEELCGTCRMFFDYYGDGGSDKCSSECDSNKCAYYEPIGFCPNCGAKMDGERIDNEN